MRPFPGLRGGIAFALALAAAAACSKTPQYYDDLHAGGHATSSSSSATSSSGGAGPECANPGDCGVPDTECAHPTCTKGVCGTTFAPMGTMLAAQVPGDCKTAVCDGAGHVTAVANPTDVDDGNPCTDDSCSDTMTPVHTPSAHGKGCGMNDFLVCDGSGACTGCVVASECGADGACFQWNCDVNVCKQVFTPAGMGDPGGNAPGDCQHDTCDGMGGVMAVADATDPPHDLNACNAGACNGTTPATQPKPAGTTCPGGVCDGSGHCGTCTTDAECGAATACATPVCAQHHCSQAFVPSGMPTQQQMAGDCQTQICDGAGNATTTPDDTDKPADPDVCHTASCSGGSVMIAAVPPPPTNNACTQNVCDPAHGFVEQNLPDGTGCGGCSACQGGACTDPCPGIGCVCNGVSCDCGSGG